MKVLLNPEVGSNSQSQRDQHAAKSPLKACRAGAGERHLPPCSPMCMKDGALIFTWGALLRQLPGKSSFVLGRKAWERRKELELFHEWL